VPVIRTARLRSSCDAEQLKLSSDDGDSGCKKSKQVGGARGGLWQGLRLSVFWSLKSGCRMYVGAFDAAKTFSRLI
jgi:hypothetical protein